MDIEARRRMLLSLIEASVLAPSGDNTQPWCFHVDAAQARITFFVDPTRDPSPMNSGQRMARIAVGAALENVVRTAELNGCEVELEQPDGEAAAQVRIENLPTNEFRREQVIAQRVTNRRAYERKPIPNETLTQLAACAPELEGTITRWVVDRERIDTIAKLIGQADATMFGEPSMRQAFLSKVRFDAPASEEVSEGLCTGSLEVNAAGRLGLKFMAGMPGWAFRASGATAAFSSLAKKLVRSASGLCLVIAPDSATQSDLAVGRSMQRAWLGLAQAGLASQPMMSLMVLDNLLENGQPDLVNAVGKSKLLQFRSKLHSIFPMETNARAAFLLRFGYAAPPSARTGRMSIQDVTTAAPELHHANVTS